MSTSTPMSIYKVAISHRQPPPHPSWKWSPHKTCGGEGNGGGSSLFSKRHNTDPRFPSFPIDRIQVQVANTTSFFRKKKSPIELESKTLQSNESRIRPKSKGTCLFSKKTKSNRLVEINSFSLEPFPTPPTQQVLLFEKETAFRDPNSNSTDSTQ